MTVSMLIDRRAFRPLLTTCFLLAACSAPPAESPDHPEYFDQVFIRADGFGAERTLAAFDFLDSIYAAFPNPGPLDLARKYEYKLSYHWQLKKDALMGREYADSILEVLSGKTDDPDYATRYGTALLFIGDMVKEEGKYNDAFSFYYEGRSYIRKAGDTCFFGEYSSRIAMTYYKQNRFQDAIPHFREAFSARESCRDDPFYKFRFQQAELDNIGLCYHHLGLYDSAMFYYDRALRYIAKNSIPFLDNPSQLQFVKEANAVVYGNKGSLLLKRGDTAAAEKLYLESITANLKGGSETRDAQITITKLVTLLMLQKRFSDADHWLTQMRHSLDVVPDAINELQWQKLRSRYFAATGNPDQGLAALQRYVQLKDSADKASHSLPGIDIQKEFGYLAKSYELSLLKKQNEIKTIYLYIAIVFSAMTILIIYLIWQHWRRSKKHVDELSRLNQQILIQHEQMSKSLSALEQSQLDNSRMMKIVAHDLRNPVGAIMTLTELIYMKDSDQPGEIDDLLGMMKESGEKALDLISELLHLNVTTETEMELVQIDLVLQYCVDLLRIKAKEKSQKIVLRTIPATLPASREKIWRVFSNLITNAVKFSRKGAAIEINMRRVNGTLRISVKDEGIGIPPDMKDKIFSMSAGAGRKGTLGEESFGLGLAISKQIVESHSGKIWFESEEGKGSVFYVDLRISPAS